MTVIAIDRPDVRNALHYPAHCELQAAFDEFAADAGQRVAIVTGTGDRAFCAGHDLKHPVDPGHPLLPPGGFAGLTGRFDLDKPVVAAVNGLALGGGFEIALAADLVIAAETAGFGLPEPKFGLAALAGGLHRLPRQIGLKRAMGLILTARRIDAAEAAAMGLVNQVVPLPELMATAAQWAAGIVACDPLAIRASKQAVMRGLDGTLERAMADQMVYPAVVEMMDAARRPG